MPQSWLGYSREATAAWLKEVRVRQRVVGVEDDDERGHPEPGIEPGTYGYASRALPVELSEISSVTTFQSLNNFLFNTITEKYLLKYCRNDYLSIDT
ncbi:Protein of unknown function [Cotesia congregata]|uniref:Uncharacterized protein n=1 Tax=Cotesia congregata TaxID=51543 RepID=A0A8J2EB04_COTCN|nr:Protein of unknown function [Cotesia congregata]